MTAQQVLGVGIRLYAVWLALSSVRYLSSVPVALARADELAERVYQSYIVGAAYLVAAILLWVFPMFIAHKLIPRTSFTDRISVSAFDAARVGSALLGLWLFAKSFSDVVWLLFSAMLITTSGSMFDSISRESRVDLVVSVVMIALAIILMVGSGFFARLALHGQGEEK